MPPEVVGDEAAVLRQHASNLWLEAEMTLGEAVNEQDLGARRIAPFIRGEPRPVGRADLLDGGHWRHLFSMFHSTVTGAFSQPTTSLRAAPGPYHWPSHAYCAVSSARFCTAVASALDLAGSVSLE